MKTNKMNLFDYELKKLQERVTDGGMSRRNIIKAASAMGLSAAAPALYSQAVGPTRGDIEID